MPRPIHFTPLVALVLALGSAGSLRAQAATELRFDSQPTETRSGDVISPAVTVRATDSGGVTDTSFTGDITISIATDPSGGPAVLSGTKTVAAIDGVATFDDLSINRAGSGYTLGAESVGLTPATSGPFDITASALLFEDQPTNTQAGDPITPAVTVRAVDITGATDPNFTGSVTMAIGNNAGGGTLSGTTPVLASGGVATFSDLSIDKTGSGYTLSASSSGLAGDTSTGFDITPGPAATLAFVQQPTTTEVGATITPAVTVEALDAFGNRATGFGGSVEIAIGTNPPGDGVLSGTTPVTASNGVATFDDLSIDKTGSGYTLVASSGALTDATSDPFEITALPPVALRYVQQPTTTEAGDPISPAVTVEAIDENDDRVTTFTGSVSIAIQNNPGGGTLSGTTMVSASNGVATFSNLSIDKTGTGYTLRATSSGLTGVTSDGFDITPGPAASLAFVQQPTETEAGSVITPPVTVEALDAFGNRATGFTGSVSVVIKNNPGSGTLSGDTSVTASSGVATFSDLSIDEPGDGYTLEALSSGLTAATSVAFEITALPATALRYVQQPTTTEAGDPITPAVTVEAIDANGDRVTTFTESVSIAIQNNAGGGTLSGMTTVLASNGVATFSNLSIDKTGTGYTLRATSSGLTGVTSGGFDITPGPAASLAFVQQPTETEEGSVITPAVTVEALDAFGNLATGFGGNVTVEIDDNPGGGTLSGDTSVTASSGVATFSDLSIDEPGTGYTLEASSAGLTGTTSDSFDITALPATALRYVQQPTTTEAGDPITPAVTVEAIDANGDRVTTFTESVSIAIQNNAGGGTLSGMTTVLASNGVATFSNLSIDKTGTGYTLRATSSGLTGVTSGGFDITPGPAASLAFVQQPTDTGAGAAISPAVTVRALDAFGNLATGFGGSVTIAIQNNPGGGTLSGTTPVSASNGVATFSNLSIDRTGTGYTLRGTSSGLSGATSVDFDITPGPASGDTSTITASPMNIPADGSSTSTITVRLRDEFDNDLTSGGDTVVLSTSAGSLSAVTDNGNGTYTATLTSSTTAGIATVSGTVNGDPIDDDADVEFLPGDADMLEFQVQPTNTVAGEAISPAVEVRAADQNGNTVTSFNGTVTIDIGNNPGGGTLSGTVSVQAVNGEATFSNLSIDMAGSGYTLSADASGLAGTTSAPFDIVPGPASPANSTITASPTTITADGTSASTITVRLRDAFGNPLATGGDTVTLSTTAGTLSGVTDNGDGTYTASLTSTSAGSATITGAVNGQPIADDATVTFVPGDAGGLEFIVQPTSTVAGETISPPVEVRVVDQTGNTVTSFNGIVTMTIGVNPLGASLMGTTSVNAVSGVATFANLSIVVASAGYALAAEASGLAGVTSASFQIFPGPPDPETTLITAIPSSIPADGATVTTIVVQLLDEFGNPLKTGGASVTLSTTAGTMGIVLDNGDGTFSAILTAPTTPGTATVTGTLNGQPITDDATVTFTGASTGSLVFDVEPADTPAGQPIDPPVVVRALDDQGDTDTGFTGDVTLEIGTNPAGGTLSGTATVAAVAGIATFAGLSIDAPGAGYTLFATGGGLTPATSAPFAILGGGGGGGEASPATTTITASPTAIQADGQSTSTITVQARDAAGAALATGGDTVTLSTTAGTLSPVADNGNGTYTATLTSAAAQGTATITGTLNGQTIADTATVTFTGESADLRLTMSVDDTTPSEGDTIVYTVTILNAGPGVATGVEVDSPLPARVRFVSAEASQGTYDPATGAWDVGRLDVGGQATLALEVVVTNGGT